MHIRPRRLTFYHQKKLMLTIEFSIFDRGGGKFNVPSYNLLTKMTKSYLKKLTFKFSKLKTVSSVIIPAWPGTRNWTGIRKNSRMG